MIYVALWITACVVVLWAAVAALELVGAFVGACCDAVHGDGKSTSGKEIGDLTLEEVTSEEVKDWLRRSGL